MLEMTFNDFEALLERLNAARQFRMRGLAEYVETLSACASGEQQPNAYLPPPDRAPLLLRQMFWALESVERGESGAAREFRPDCAGPRSLLREQSRCPREPAAASDTQR